MFKYLPILLLTIIFQSNDTLCNNLELNYLEKIEIARTKETYKEILSNSSVSKF